MVLQGFHVSPAPGFQILKFYCFEIHNRSNNYSILGGPYAGFAGRDASRGLATFSVDAITDEYDDLLDLKASEIEQVCDIFKNCPVYPLI